MALLTLKNIYYSIGQFPLLDYVNFEINPRERIALIGRNGEGKSTLLKIISQQLLPDSGEVQKLAPIRVARLAQELPAAEGVTIYEAVAAGLQELSDLLIQYHHLSHQTDGHDEAWMNQLHQTQEKIDTLGGWDLQLKVDKTLQALSLPADTLLSSLSGGWLRRVALAQALVQEPDILLLDEPTNHLDLAAIRWLEEWLLNYPKTVLFITHDRMLLRKIATKIVELDRGKLTVFPPDYDEYLSRKAQLLIEEERHNALFDKKLSEEEQWIRQGVKARRTRNEGRVRALEALRAARQQRRVLKDKPSFETNDPNTAGKTVIQAKNITFGYDHNTPLIKDFNFTIQRGDKIAIVGPNGAGKTTLLKILLGEIEADSGTIKHSPTNQIAFFDQHRAQLDPEQSVMDNVAQGDDHIDVQGKRKHVISYLGDFLFSPNKCRMKANTLSGGEQNRLMLAKLFAKTANVLVLDEPTNDLDIDSLDVLENLLLNYAGTVIIISHDREFINNIATHCIVFEPGKVTIHVGGLNESPVITEKSEKSEKSNKSNKPNKTDKQSEKNKKPALSYKEQQSLAAYPLLIEKLETDIKQLEDKICSPEFHDLPKEKIQGHYQELEALKTQLAQNYSDWEALEARS